MFISRLGLDVFHDTFYLLFLALCVCRASHLLRTKRYIQLSSLQFHYILSELNDSLNMSAGWIKTPNKNITKLIELSQNQVFYVMDASVSVGVFNKLVLGTEK